MVLDMFTKRTKARAKACQQIGKIPKALDIHKKLQGYTDALIANFKETKNTQLIPLYDMQPELSYDDIHVLSRTISYFN